MKVNDTKERLVKELSQNIKVLGIAQTGDINAELIRGSSDIDMFVLCTGIPTEEERKQVYSQYSDEYTECWMNVCSGGIWGYGDILIIDGIDVMFMYFTMEEMENYLEEVLQGKHLDRVGGFYPTGRLSSVENINILFERNSAWTGLKEKVKKHPEDLYKKLFHYHIDKVLDEEDLGRVLLRKEVLFYHQVLENSMDHLLQALFAVNRMYFPSRKRTEQYLNAFKNIPAGCTDRLLQMIKNSVQSETIEESVSELKTITAEIAQIGQAIFQS